MFNGQRVRQAREYKGLTQTKLAKLIGVTQGAIAQIEGGFKSPSAEVMEKIAAHTQFPLGFFTSELKTEFPREWIMFRSHASMTKRNAVQACRYSEIVYEIFCVLEPHLNLVPVTLPDMKGDDPDRAARGTRKALRVLTDEPIQNLTNVVESVGVIILSLPTQLGGPDAFSFWLGTETPRPIIAISNEQSMDRLRFSIAHEVGHLVLGHIGKYRPEEEIAANRFAAELLMPQRAMRWEILSPVTLSAIAALKPRWKVSIQALVRRAFDLSIISDRQYRYLFEQISSKGWRTKEPANLDIPQEKPRSLRQMAEIVYGNPIDYGRLATEANLHTNAVKQIVESYAEGPSVHRKDGKISYLRR
jgi:Zn-dependent peptidase ImmA (M78 family)/transcriptional regulator with XRE-family HTH domain